MGLQHDDGDFLKTACKYLLWSVIMSQCVCVCVTYQPLSDNVSIVYNTRDSKTAVCNTEDNASVSCDAQGIEDCLSYEE